MSHVYTLLTGLLTGVALSKTSAAEPLWSALFMIAFVCICISAALEAKD